MYLIIDVLQIKITIDITLKIIINKVIIAIHWELMLKRNNLTICYYKIHKKLEIQVDKVINQVQQYQKNKFKYQYKKKLYIQMH